MASMYTPEEIEELKAREADEIKRLGQATVETRMALLDMSAGVKGLTATLTGGLGMLGTSALGLGKDLAAGKIGVTVFNKSIDGVAGALGNLLGLIPYIGPALKTLVKGVGDYSQAVNEQAELLYNNYQEMSKIGAAGAEGMQGVYDNLKRMNYGTEELDKFVSIVRENATTLANFGGTVGQGLNEIARVSASVQSSDIGRQFMDMGMSVDQINKGIAGFNKMQVLYGARQKMTADEQTTAVANYINKVDLLAKVTGQNAEKQMALEESALTQERYAGYRLKLKIKAENATDQATKDAINAQLDMVDAVQKDLADTPEARLGFLNMLSKTLDDPMAAKSLQSFPRAAAVAAKEFFTASEYQAAMMEDMRTSREATAEMASMGINNSTYNPINEIMTLEAKFMKGSLDERMKLAAAEQKMTNKATQDYTDIQIANRKSRDVFQDLLNAGIPKITAAMKGAATATDAVTGVMEKIAEKMGITVKKRDEPGAAAQAAPRPAAAASTPSGAAAGGAAASGKSGAAPAKPSSRPPEESGAGTAAAAADLTKIMKFTANSGSRQAFDGLNSTFKDSVIAAATDYNKLTGGMLQINSAKRDPADQQRLWDESVAAGRTGVTASGMPIGKPGRPNSHEQGKAIDIQNYRDPMAVAALNKYGLSQKVPNDPVHFQAANGGVVPPLPGGVNVLAGEAGQSEAVVPLPDGKTIPVQMVGNEAQMSMMAAQLDRLDQMVRIMQNQVGVSEQILKYAQ